MGEFKNIAREKELRMPYDSDVGLGAEVEAEEGGAAQHKAWPEEPSL